MIKKFECKECKQRFEADDSKIVNCPHCHSDNVEYASFHIPSWVWKSIGGIIITICLIWFGETHGVFKRCYSVSSDTTSTDSTIKHIEEVNTEYVQITGEEIRPSLSIINKKYNDDNDTYSFQIKVSPSPKQKWKIIISSFNNEIQIAENNNGIFKDIPYSKDNGIYRVKLIDASTGNLLCEERDFPEFERQTIVKKPWTAIDIENLLNSYQWTLDDPQIINHVSSNNQVIVVNKPDNDLTNTGSLGQVSALMKDCALTAKVLAIEYDELKKISKVKLSINYPSDWIDEDE